MIKFGNVHVGNGSLVGWNDSLDELRSTLGEDTEFDVVNGPNKLSPKYTVRLQTRVVMPENSFAGHFNNYIRLKREYSLNFQTKILQPGYNAFMTNGLQPVSAPTLTELDWYELKEFNKARRQLLGIIDGRKDDFSNWSKEQLLNALELCVRYDF